MRPGVERDVELGLIAEIVHIVLWKLKAAASEEAANAAKQAIAALKTVPGPEQVRLATTRNNAAGAE
jgi:hypothetical protein